VRTLARRTALNYKGTAYPTAGTTGIDESYGYNARNELTHAERAGSAWERDYSYDPIGNRLSLPAPSTEEYATNGLNQYTATSNLPQLSAAQSYEYDDDGNLKREIVPTVIEVSSGLGTLTDAEQYAWCMSGPGGAMPPSPCDPQSFAQYDYDQDGDLDLADFAGARTSTTVDQGRTFKWDSENRLISVEPTYPAAFTDVTRPPKVVFTYDYQGRRIQKRVLNWSTTLNNNAGGWDEANPVLSRQYIWHGWLLLLELNNLSPLRSYVWGLDLAGLNGQVNSLEGAGGIGGLVAASDWRGTSSPQSLWYFYDLNGNVTQTEMMAFGRSQGVLVGHYEYDPYGQTTASLQGEYDQPFRFSTKQYDAEIGLYYFGYRYYNPGLGRWVSRDPIGENGGLHRYHFVAHSPTQAIDPHGLLGLLPSWWPNVPNMIWGPNSGTFWKANDAEAAAARDTYFKEFSTKYCGRIRAAAKKYCIPAALLATIIAAEDIDRKSGEAFLEGLGFGDTVGIAQIGEEHFERAIDPVAYREWVEGLPSHPIYIPGGGPPAGTQKPPSSWRDCAITDSGSIDMAANLMRQRLDQLCRDSRATPMVLSKAFLNLANMPYQTHTGFDLSAFCCRSGKCDEIRKLRVPSYLVRAMAAIWDGGYATVFSNSIPGKTTVHTEYADNAGNEHLCAE